MLFFMLFDAYPEGGEVGESPFAVVRSEENSSD